jgi:hypothetical protein
MRIGDKGLLLVMIDIDPEHEAEFDAWYEKEHLPERLACPGFLTGRRYVAVEGGPKYLALYDLESPDVLESEAYGAIAVKSAWWTSIEKRFAHAVRNVYVEILRDDEPKPDPRSRFRPEVAREKSG